MSKGNKDLYYQLQTITNSENHYIKISDDILKSDMYKRKLRKWLWKQ